MNRIQALDQAIIDRLKSSVLSICDNEDPTKIIATALVWDYSKDEVLILTNYHTWTDEYSYCFPPPPPPDSPITPKNKKKKGKNQKKRKLSSSSESDLDVHDPAHLILKNEDGFNYQFTLTSEVFYTWGRHADFAVLKFPRIPIFLIPCPTMYVHAIGYVAHTSNFLLTGGEISGIGAETFTMNLLSAPGYSGAAIVSDYLGRAVGYMGGNLDFAKEKNSQHQSYAYKFDMVMLATDRKVSPNTPPVKLGVAKEFIPFER